MAEEHKDKARQYNKYARDKQSESFYNSVPWRKLREVAFARDLRLCQYCLESGTIKKADVVHHVQEVREAWHLRLDLNNLVSICHGCHNKEHGERDRKKKVREHKGVRVVESKPNREAW